LELLTNFDNVHNCFFEYKKIVLSCKNKNFFLLLQY